MNTGLSYSYTKEYLFIMITVYQSLGSVIIEPTLVVCKHYLAVEMVVALVFVTVSPNVSYNCPLVTAVGSRVRGQVERWPQPGLFQLIACSMV